MHTKKKIHRPLLCFDPVVLLSVPKSPQDTNEDYAGVSGCRVAISDGTGSSAAPHLFSKLLVHRALEHDPPWGNPLALEEWLSGIRADWEAVTGAEELSPIARIKYARGSHATLCTLRIDSVSIASKFPMARYTVSAMGDSVFVHIRRGEVLSVFPLSRPEDFGSAPPLLSTDASYVQRTIPFSTTQSGWFLNEDSFLLMTDALARWFCVERQVGRRPWETLLGLRQTQFAQYVNSWRRHGALEQDDTTLVWAHLKIEGCAGTNGAPLSRTEQATALLLREDSDSEGTRELELTRA